MFQTISKGRSGGGVHALGLLGFFFQTLAAWDRRMTLPDERLRALHYARDLLRGLLDPQQTPRVPREVRRWASRVLRHYPMDFEIDDLADHPMLGGKRKG